MVDVLLENRRLLLSEKINGLLGLDFPENRWRDLERGLKKAAAELGYRNLADFADRLLSTNNLSFEQIQALARHLTIGETYFFRDKQLFHLVGKNVLKPLLASRSHTDKRLRIWSAGCSSGEEAYSIAMLLDSLVPDLKSWQIKILATDINPQALEKAKTGHYSSWSFRQMPPDMKRKYFRKHSKNSYSIVPEIKRMVSFEYLNLATQDFPSLLNDTVSMDVIFCRNVLMYFKRSLAKVIVEKFYQSLSKDGWLVLSPVEAPTVSPGLFNTNSQCGPAVFRKKISEIAFSPKPHQSHRKVQIETPITMVAPGGQGNKERCRAVMGGRAIKKAPGENFTESYKFLLSLYRSGRYEDALKWSHELAETAIEPKTKAKIYGLQTRIYANQGKLEEAYLCCQKALRHDKLNPRLYYLCATIKQEFGQIDEAIAALRRAIYLYPEYVLAHFALGNLLKQKGNAADWNRSYENVLTLIQAREPNELIPGSEGMTVTELKEIIESIL